MTIKHNIFEHRQRGNKRKPAHKGPAQKAGRMSPRKFKVYVQKMLEDEWMLPDEIPVPVGYRKRHVLRRAALLGHEQPLDV